MRAAVYILGGAIVIALSFWATLYLIDNWSRLSTSEFDNAMKKAGYIPSDAIVFSLDDARRDLNGRLSLSGWAIDKEQGKPVSILVYTGKRFAHVATTKGARPDVAASLHLSAEMTKDIVFSGRTDQPIDCKQLEHAPVVAVNQRNHLVKMADGLHIATCR